MKDAVEKQQVTKTEAPPAPAPVVRNVASMETSSDPVERALHRFVGLHIHNSPVSANTEAYNHLMVKLPELTTLIEEETGK